MIAGTKRSEREYRKLETLSASDLKVFATEDRRTFFKKCVLKQKDDDEEESRASKIGSVVHCLMLEPEEFDKKYCMSICTDPPTGNMKKFVDALYKHTIANIDELGEVQIGFTELAKLAYKDSGIKRDKLETVINNFRDKEPELYYREKRNCGFGNKELLCTADRNIADKIVENLKYHEHTRDIFGPDTTKELQVENFNIDGLELKAMLDDVDIQDDFVYITDLKVTWTNDDFYREYFLKRRADIQALVYKAAMKHYYPEKAIMFKFVVADSTNFNAPLVYEVGDKWDTKTYEGFWDNGKYYKGLRSIISDLKWHIETGNWSVSKTNFDNLGIIKL